MHMQSSLLKVRMTPRWLSGLNSLGSVYDALLSDNCIVVSISGQERGESMCILSERHHVMCLI